MFLDEGEGLQHGVQGGHHKGTNLVSGQAVLHINFAHTGDREIVFCGFEKAQGRCKVCLLYTSDAADDLLTV